MSSKAQRRLLSLLVIAIFLVQRSREVLVNAHKAPLSIAQKTLIVH